MIFSSIKVRDLASLSDFIRKERSQIVGGLFDDRGYTILHAAASVGWLDGVIAILEFECLPVDCLDRFGEDKTALYVAVYEGHLDVASYLMKKGANMNTPDKEYGMTPLHIASRFGFLEIGRLLLEAGADINGLDSADRSTPLHLAAENKHSSLCDLLISKGADTTIKDMFGDTFADRKKVG